MEAFLKKFFSLVGNVAQCWSVLVTTWAQTEIAQQLLEGYPFNFFTDIYCPQMMNTENVRDPLAFHPLPPAKALIYPVNYLNIYTGWAFMVLRQCALTIW